MKTFKSFTGKRTPEPTETPLDPEVPLRKTKPNLPTEGVPKSTQQINTGNMQPVQKTAKEKEKLVEFYGKVARLPKGTKASEGLRFLQSNESKLASKNIWYIMVEKQDDHLQMLRYDPAQGEHLSDFVVALKEYYLNHFSKYPDICEKIQNIVVEGDESMVMIKNIPKISINNESLIKRITVDLIRTLKV